MSPAQATFDHLGVALAIGLLTFVLGALAASGQVAVAAAGAVVVALLLSAKPVLHHWLGTLRRQELSAGLQLLLLSVVVLPLLPDQGFGPWQTLNSYRIWWMVVLIAAISFIGYFAVKEAGARKGGIFTGLFAGLASSTALTLHFSRLARGRPDLGPMLATGIPLASGTMFRVWPRPWRRPLGSPTWVSRWCGSVRRDRRPCPPWVSMGERPEPARGLSRPHNGGPAAFGAR